MSAKPELKLDLKSTEKLLKGIKIPLQPQLLVDIQMELAMPDYTLSNLAKLINKDVSIAGSILKIVNSSFYGLGKTITSINQAIGLLGIKSITNIINSISLRESLSGDQAAKLIKFWDNAIDIAASCHYLAKTLHIADADEAYALGLFHNCAVPLLSLRFENYLNVVKDSYANGEQLITKIESDALATNHAVVGYYVAKSWKLPIYICEAIAEHHDCKKLFDKADVSPNNKTNLLAILKLAEHLCCTYKNLGESELDHEFIQLQDPLLRYLGLLDSDLLNFSDDLFELGLTS